MWEFFWIAIVVLIIYKVFLNTNAGQKVEMMSENVPLTKYYSTINKICFYVCTTSVMAGFILTLLMIWEVFENKQVVEKSWLSLALFFGTALIIAMLNNMFAVRIAKRKDGNE